MTLRDRIYRRTRRHSLRRVAREVRGPEQWLHAWLRGEVAADRETAHRLLLSAAGRAMPGPVPEVEVVDEQSAIRRLCEAVS